MALQPIAKQLALDAISRERLRRQTARVDIADWAERHFYIRDTRQPIRLMLHQKAVLRAMFKRNPAGSLLFHEGIYSAIKKSGKTTVGGLVGRWCAETQTNMGEVMTIGNDGRQAREREFKMIVDSIRLTPGCRRMAGEWVLPDQWRCQMRKMDCFTSGTRIEAISVDAAGEAGSAPDMTLWTETWGLQATDAEEFWNEMTPVLTKPDSFRFVETYAGYSGESKLLEDHYNLGKSGRQLTAGELAEMTCRDAPGETYEHMLWAFEETQGDPHAPVPVWVHENAGLFMYWDEDEPEGVARRMPWQKGPAASAYYREQAQLLTKGQCDRLHRNKWSAPEGEFIPMEVWDACREQLPPFLPENKEPCVIAADAATTGDCFAVVATTRHPDRPKDPAIRACKKWDPKKEGGAVDYSKPEAFMRTLCLGGCAMGHPLLPDKSGFDPRFTPGVEQCGACRDNVRVAPYNVMMIAYDPFQLEDMMQRIRRETGVRCKKFDQGRDRLIADHGFYTAVLQKRLAHDGNSELREHVENAASKTSTDEDSKMRIVKKSPDKKIDLAVAASMGVREIMRLMLTAEG